MTTKKNLGDKAHLLWQLSRRPMKIFLKDGMTVFFSVLAPLIILLLYVLFLGDVQVSSVKAAIPESFNVDEKTIKAFVDSWMVSGVLSVSCLSVSLSANTIMVQDSERGARNDMLASPVSGGMVTLGYFVYNLLVTLFICTIVYAVCLIYLAFSGGFTLTFAACAETFGIMLLSCLSSTLITVFIAGFFKTNSAFSAFVGIFSAVVGFIIGAYMPLNMYPDAMQGIVCFFPGTHSAGLFRNALMSNALEKLSDGLPEQFTSELAKNFSMEMDFFGNTVTTTVMYIVLAASVVLFLAVNIAKGCLESKRKNK